MNKKFIISESSTIKDALIAINDITHDGESLVVINLEQEIINPLLNTIKMQRQMIKYLQFAL